MGEERITLKADETTMRRLKPGTVLEVCSTGEVIRLHKLNTDTGEATVTRIGLEREGWDIPPEAA